MRLSLSTIFLFAAMATGQAQRQYAANSVLASGDWYKVAVASEGMYKVDVPLLNSLGINTSNIASSSIRIFGNGGAMLPENCSGFKVDDLFENGIEVFDGGDGRFDGTDYLIFYAPGPHAWLKDSANKSFRRQVNHYSNFSYYYIYVGGSGKRVGTASPVGMSNVSVTSFNERIHHEKDTVNFLKSGKEWFGEEFSNTPGNTLNRSLSFNVPNLQLSSPVFVASRLVGRSVGTSSRFDVRVNGFALPPVIIPAVSGNFLESFGVEGQTSASFVAADPNLTVNYSFNPGSFNAQGWLNWLSINCRRALNVSGTGQLSFRDWESVGSSNVASYQLTGAVAGSQVWDVTEPLSPVRMALTGAGNVSFIRDASRLREFIYFNGNSFLAPTPIGKVVNQNLHASPVSDYIIITPPSFKSEANRLANFHVGRGLRTVVATTDEVYNEFSSGTPDPAAIRDFVKMFYDRAGADSTRRPKYLLLFGDGSFDYKNRINNNTNFVTTYQSQNSLDPLGTYTSDDFFGLMDDADDINLTSPPSLLDIGIGRIPASTVSEAKVFVDKVVHYHSPATLGSWRNNITFVADDEDGNLHLNDAEAFSSTTSTINPLFNLNKIYLDAYRQESGSGGSRYPSVNQAIASQVYNGTLVWNYSGHGGSTRLAEEAVLDQEVIRQFNNPNKLPLMITATCDFAPFDDPTQRSIGENLLVENNKGAIALTTTTRFVFASSNKIINNNYLAVAMQPGADGNYKTLGDALKLAKNITYSSSPDIINNRKFLMLGDPAMKLAFPELRVRINTINGRPAATADTLKALEKCTITGELTDGSGNALSSFNGSVYPTVFDKAQPITTLANDPASLPTTFVQQTNALYKGKASVKNGHFEFSFIVPKDINYQVGNGRISLYAENNTRDANGVNTSVLIGGSGTAANNDKEGPTIRAYLNDEKFVNGGLVNKQPVLILKLADSSGINIAGTGIGHDLVAKLDNDDKKLFVLNDFYEAALDDFKQGTVRFQLPELEPGVHTLTIKAWDVANNSHEIVLEFVVANGEQLQLSHVLNYPNPFTTHTTFWFEHNQPQSSLKVLIQIYSVAGKLVHQIQKQVQTIGNRSSELEWDGRDAYGDRVGRGVYIYRISVTGTDGLKAEKLEKLYVL